MLLDENNHNELRNGYRILSYNTRWLQSYNEAVFLFQSSYFIVKWQLGSHQVLNATWLGELSDNYSTNIYVYCNKGRRNCGC